MEGRGSGYPNGESTLFSDDRPSPEGLSYTTDFLTIAEERELIERAAARPLTPFQFGIYEGKRRVVCLGARYGVTPAMKKAPCR